MEKKLLTNLVLATSLMAYLLLASVAQGGDIENLAKSLAKIRGEVEELQARLDIEKEKHGSRMSALSSQLADLSVEERRQNISIEKLQHTIEKMAASSKQAEKSGEKLKPVLLEILADYRQYVLNGLPFKVGERIQAIDNLENNLVNQLVDPNKAVNQTWSLIEDEIRLSKENGIYQQTILLNGEKVLADIAKLGTVFLFFQTRDNRVGMAQNNGGWKFVTLDSSNDAERIAKLFDAMKKQIRQGYFELPNPMKL